MPYRIVPHADDPHLADRACVLRPAAGLVARCAAACTTILSADTPHVHLLYGRNQYGGYCSEGCAIKGARYLGLIGDRR